MKDTICLDQVKVYQLDAGDQWRQQCQARLYWMQNSTGEYCLMLQFSPFVSSGSTYNHHNTVSVNTNNEINVRSITSVEVEKGSVVYLETKTKEAKSHFALSFMDSDGCSMLTELISLTQTGASTLCLSGDIDQQRDLKWYLFLLNEQNPFYVDKTFEDMRNMNNFCQMMRKELEEQKKDFNMDALLLIVKRIFLRASPKILEMMLAEPNFLIILKCLSLNTSYANKRFDYYKEYEENVKVTNVLHLQEPDFLQPYIENVKAYFLKDIALCTFIDIQCVNALEKIISDNHNKILGSLVGKNGFFDQLKVWASENPLMFLQLFCQLWRIFKSIPCLDFGPKKDFYEMTVGHELHIETIRAAHRLLQSGTTSRIYEKWLAEYNPLLSADWSFAQKFILEAAENTETNLLEVLLQIFTRHEYSTKCTVLQFVFNLIQVTDNRKWMQPKFLRLVFESFVLPAVVVMTDTNQLEIAIGFITDCYSVQPLRTRRIIIKSRLFESANAQIHNKYVLIASFKLLRAFIDKDNEDIFQYLQNNKVYELMRLKASTTAKRRIGLLHSILSGLFEKVKTASNAAGKNYLAQLFRIPQ